jgi:GGDEF domain-containing protein
MTIEHSGHPNERDPEHEAKVNAYLEWQASLRDLPAEEREQMIAETLARKDRAIETEKRLKEAALIDAVTGLPTRAVFDTVHDYIFWQTVPYGLIHVDVDHFKRVNDKVGHLGGDKALKEISTRLRRNIRHGNNNSDAPYALIEEHREHGDVQRDFIGRLGGEEFGILLAGVTSEQTLFDRAEILRNSIRTSRVLVEQGPERHATLLPITISIGGVIRRPYMTSPQDVYRIADRQGYISKENGRNMTTIFVPGAEPLSTRRV